MSNNKFSGPIIMTRRDFLLASAAAGAGLIATAGMGQTPAPAADQLNIALIGAGEQGRVLLESIQRIPDVRVKAICDIWDYSLRYATRLMKKYGHEAVGYEDYKEMLANEKDLDAVIVASPDFMHAEHTNAALKAGLHVYSEKEMSNTLEGARSMVETARSTGKLLQIGHQRRSNPRYIHAINKLVREEKILGRMTHANAQWNRSKSEDFGWPEKYEIPKEKLAKYGYGSMREFRNWRWFKKYGGGPIVDLGSHQIDIFNWVFGPPSSVLAGGGVDFYPDHEWYDNVMAIFEYPTPQGNARAFYQVLTTTKHGQFYETFMGENGSLVISELPNRGNTVWREAHAPEWDQYAEKGWLKKTGGEVKQPEVKDVAVDVRVTPLTASWTLPVELAKMPHQPHLENFFDAIRKGTPLNCPAEMGYETAVAVLKVNAAVEAAKKLTYEKGEFVV